MENLRKIKKIVNLTPHPLIFVNSNGKKILEIEPSGIIPRVRIDRKVIGKVVINGKEIEVRDTKVVADIEPSLPKPKDGIIFVVSKMVAEALSGSGRSDIYIVDEAVKGESGYTIGVRGLTRLYNGKKEVEDILEVVDLEDSQFYVEIKKGKAYVGVFERNGSEVFFEISIEQAKDLINKMNALTDNV